jgi:hypothetical protein
MANSRDSSTPQTRPTVFTRARRYENPVFFVAGIIISLLMVLYADVLTAGDRGRLVVREVTSFNLLEAIRPIQGFPIEMYWVDPLAPEQQRRLTLKHLTYAVVRFENPGRTAFAWKARSSVPLSLRLESGEFLACTVQQPRATASPISTHWQPRGKDLVVDTPFLNGREEFVLQLVHTAPSNSDLRVEATFMDHPPLQIVRRVVAPRPVMVSRPFLVMALSLGIGGAIGFGGANSVGGSRLSNRQRLAIALMALALMTTSLVFYAIMRLFPAQITQSLMAFAMLYGIAFVTLLYYVLAGTATRWVVARTGKTGSDEAH